MHTFNMYLINDKISLDVISLDVICEVYLFYKKDFLLAKNIDKMFHWQKAPRKIYLLYFKKGKSFWKKIFAGINCRDRSFPARSCFFFTYHDIWFQQLLFFSKQNFFLIFFSIKCDSRFFLTFPLFCYILGIWTSCIKKFQDFCSINCIFRQIFLPFQLFAGIFRVLLLHEQKHIGRFSNLH